MKKKYVSIALILIAASFTTYGVINWNTADESKMIPTKEDTTKKTDPFINPFVTKIIPEVAGDIYLAVGSRYRNEVSREALHDTKSIKELLENDASKEIVSYYDGKIVLLNDRDEEIIIKEYNGALSEIQLNLLRSLDYATNLYAEAYCEVKNKEDGQIIETQVVKYITTVPENEAAYEGGAEGMIQYIVDNSKKVRSKVYRNELNGGRINFTVTAEGTIEDVQLQFSSKHEELDNAMLKLILNMPLKWTPASNSNGQAVDQKLVFNFGNMGC